MIVNYIAPGIAHVVEFFTYFLFFNIVFEQKKKTLTTVGCGLFGYAVVFFFYCIFRSTNINIIIGMAFIFQFAMLFFNCKIRDAAFSSLFLTVTLTASEFIIMSIISVMHGENINYYKSSPYYMIMMVIFSRTIFLVFVLLVGMLMPKSPFRKIPFFLLVFPIAATIVIYTIWVISANTDLPEKFNYLIIITSLAMIFSIFLTYIFYAKTTRKLNDFYEMDSELERIKTETAYYSILDEQNEQLKTVLHDEKNHLATIKSLANNDEVSEYIDSIYGQIEVTSLFGNTNNKILDIIINKYKYICSQLGIEFYVSIKSSNLSEVENTDLTTLLGNIFDNAIEAAKNSQRKKIDFSINKVNGMEVLTCKNTSDLKPRLVGNDLKSSKKSPGFHGLGIKSIKRIVKKYDGNFEWMYNSEEKEFTVCVIF